MWSLFEALSQLCWVVIYSLCLRLCPNFVGLFTFGHTGLVLWRLNLSAMPVAVKISIYSHTFLDNEKLSLIGGGLRCLLPPLLFFTLLFLSFLARMPNSTLASQASVVEAAAAELGCSTKCCAAVTRAPGCGSAARSRIGTISGVNRRSGGHSTTCSDSTSPRLAKATRHGLSHSIRCVAEPTEERCQKPSCPRRDRGQHGRFLSKPNVKRRLSVIEELV